MVASPTKKHGGLPKSVSITHKTFSSLGSRKTTQARTAKVTKYLFKCHSKSTQTRYGCFLKVWKKFCSEQLKNSVKVNLRCVTDFFVYCFEDLKWSPSQIAQAKSGLAFLLPCYSRLFKHDAVKQLIVGFFQCKLLQPHLRDTVWDSNIVLHALKLYPTYDKLAMAWYSVKLCLLVLLSTMARKHVLPLLDIDHMVFMDDCVCFCLTGLNKQSCAHSKPSLEAQTLDLVPYPPDSALCPVKCLIEYLNATKYVCSPTATGIFLSLNAPFNCVKKPTYAGWVKKGLCHAGIDLSVFSLHSTRGSSASTALAEGLSVNNIMARASWASLSTFMGYYACTLESRKGITQVDRIFFGTNLARSYLHSKLENQMTLVLTELQKSVMDQNPTRAQTGLPVLQHDPAGGTTPSPPPRTAVPDPVESADAEPTSVHVVPSTLTPSEPFRPSLPLHQPPEDTSSMPSSSPAAPAPAPVQHMKTVNSPFAPVPMNRGRNWQKDQTKVLQGQFKLSTLNPVRIFASVTKSQVLQFLQQPNLNTLLSAPNVRALPTTQVPPTLQDQWCQPSNVIQLQDLLVPPQLPALEHTETPAAPSETSPLSLAESQFTSPAPVVPEVAAVTAPILSIPKSIDQPTMDSHSDDNSDYDLVMVMAQDFSSVQMPPELQFVDEDGNTIPDIDAIPVPVDPPPHASTPSGDTLEPLVSPSMSSALDAEDAETVIELTLDEEGIDPLVSPTAPSSPPTVLTVDSDDEEDLVKYGEC